MVTARVEYPGSNIAGRFLNYFASYWFERESPEACHENFLKMSKAELGDHCTLRIPRDTQTVKTGNHINRMLTEAGVSEVYKSHQHGSRFEAIR